MVEKNKRKKKKGKKKKGIKVKSREAINILVAVARYLAPTAGSLEEKDVIVIEIQCPTGEEKKKKKKKRKKGQKQISTPGRTNENVKVSKKKKMRKKISQVPEPSRMGYTCPPPPWPVQFTCSKTRARKKGRELHAASIQIFPLLTYPR